MGIRGQQLTLCATLVRLKRGRRRHDDAGTAAEACATSGIAESPLDIQRVTS
jgi:hypothetical protein